MAGPQVQHWNRALVTGASSGIGEALARALAAAGTDLVVVARGTDRLETLAVELAERHGIEVEVLAADLADPDRLAVVEHRVATDESPVDLLVNNAGLGFNGRFGAIPVDDETFELSVNITALVRLCHAAVGRMKPAGHGGILNVGSLGGFSPGPGTANYSATKAYVLSFTESIHQELAGTGVHVTVLCPGFTRTEFQARGGYEPDGLPSWLWQDADVVAAAGLDAVAANRPVVVPGVHNQVAAVGVRLLPKGITRRLAGVITSRLD